MPKRNSKGGGGGTHLHMCVIFHQTTTNPTKIKELKTIPH